jgi:hypothetical protein
LPQRFDFDFDAAQGDRFLSGAAAQLRQQQFMR